MNCPGSSGPTNDDADFFMGDRASSPPPNDDAGMGDINVNSNDELTHSDNIVQLAILQLAVETDKIEPERRPLHMPSTCLDK